MFKNIPTVQSKDQNGFHIFPPILTTISRCENILITSHNCQVGYQTRSFKSTSLGLPAGWLFIPC